MGEQVGLSSNCLHSLVRPHPDAVAESIHLTLPTPRPSTRTVPLILGALRLGTQEGRLGQRAVSAIVTIKQDGFGGTFDHPHGRRALAGIFSRSADLLPDHSDATIRGKSNIVDELRQSIMNVLPESS